MRFKTQQQMSKMPNVDLIPMLNVMMAVLAFFVLISMILTPETEGVDVRLPKEEKTQSSQNQDTVSPLLVKLKADGTLELGETTLQNREELVREMQAYLQQNEKGSVLLVADPDANYERVMQLLAQMRELDRDRVSLGIENEE